jgi:hypothetical protein
MDLRWARMSIKVDLPAPEGPSRAWEEKVRVGCQGHNVSMVKWAGDGVNGCRGGSKM